jgi:formyltetrahydrofolate synthetase
MAIDYGIEILVASTETDDAKQEILNLIQSVLQDYTMAHTTATWSAGSSTTNQMSIEVTNATEDYGIAILMDSGTFGETEVISVLRKILSILDDGERILKWVVTGTGYTAGSRAYDHTLTLT